MTTPLEVLFVSSSPIHPGYPGGFAPRHHDFVGAVAARHRTAVRFLAPARRHEFEEYPCELPVESEVRDASSPTLLRRGFGHPRQAVARDTRVGPEEAELVVPLLSNVAHAVLDRGRAVCVLEEGSERGLDAVPSLSRAARWAEETRYRMLYRRIGRRPLPVVAITAREARHFSTWIAPRRIHLVPFGIDADRYRPRPIVPDIDVLIPGALNRPEQRVEELVIALRAEATTHSVTCVAAGAGHRASLAALASDRTLVVGYASDLRDLIARSKVVAIPTFTDVGIKTTMLQAWAMGRPVVTSAAVLAATPAMADVARTAAGSVEQMARRIGALLSMPGWRDEIGRTGRQFVLANHDRQRSAGSFADLISMQLDSVRRDRR